MFGLVAITPWHWAAFIFCTVVFLALDLGILHRRDHVIHIEEALIWTAIWVVVTMLFGVLLIIWRGHHEAVEFITGYVIEVSLSMDNIFVIALIFTYFRVAPEYQHRVLFWGILGALVMRGVMIVLGSALVREFTWLLYLLGAFLIYTGIRMLKADKQSVEPQKNPVLRIAQKYFPVSTGYDGNRFLTKINGRTALTSLALVLLVVETTDVVFAVDSIPAIFAVTTKPFIVFTSNVCAILGLRSLYFLLAGAIGYFRYLKVGLSIVLIFVGVKMFINPHTYPPKWFQFEIPTSVSLMVVAAIILISIALSVTAAEREKEAARKARLPEAGG